MRRVRQKTPALRAALLRALDNIEQTLTPSQLAQYIRSGSLERVFGDAGLDQFLTGVSSHLHRDVIEATSFYAKDLPGKGKLNGVFVASFDVLDPNVITAIRTLDTRVFEPLKASIRSSVRLIVEEGIREGQGPLAISRQLRDIIGLAPNQLQSVLNYRRELEAGSKAALDRKLRDRRFDTLVGRASPEQIDRMVAAYKRRFTAFNAEVNARTMTLDALKLGQRLSWDSASKRGLVDRNTLWKRWVGVKDERERPEHLAMEGEEVPFDKPFSNGQMIPGDTEFNCRCIAIYFERRARFAA